jgi:hypothetical protein
MIRSLGVLKETAEAYDIPLSCVKRINKKYLDEEFYNTLDQELINRKTRNE